MATRDPEVEAILTRTRELTSEAYRLAGDLNGVAEDLERFSGRYERRRPDAPPYEGVERRA